MTRLIFFALTLLIANAATSRQQTHYFDLQKLDVRKILETPPAHGSPQEKAEIETILKLEATISPRDLQEAKSEQHVSVWIFSSVLGEKFSAQSCPKTAAFLANIADDIGAASAVAKSTWDRPRPPLVDSRVKALVQLPDSPSFPSGHASFGEAIGTVLSKLIPNQSALVRERGLRIGDHRAMVGVHFPSDVAAGRTLADSLLVTFDSSEAYKKDFTTSAEELRTCLKSPPR